jgi:hypothetical protein
MNVAELVIEHARAVAYGLEHAVRLIEAELKRLGFDKSGLPLAPEKPAAPVAPVQGRQAPPKSKTAA